jgi:hypothetical protein
MFFGRGTYDPSAQAEAQDRLRSFQGATAISSSAYFGRDEEEGEDGAGGGGGGRGEGLVNENTLQNIESAARDAVQRVMANPEVQNAAESFRQGALKVRPVFTARVFYAYPHPPAFGLPRAAVRALSAGRETPRMPFSIQVFVLLLVTSRGRKMH